MNTVSSDPPEQARRKSAQSSVGGEPGLDGFVREIIQQYRTKLLDLSSRNPLISFRHFERSRSHIRVVDDTPEHLFEKFANGKELFFEPLPDPALAPSDEDNPSFKRLVQQAKVEDPTYKEAVSQLGPNASGRQKQRIERGLRDRIRERLGYPSFQPAWEPSKRARELGLNPDYDLALLNRSAPKRNSSKVWTLFFREDLERKLSGLRDSARVLERDAGFNALFCTFGYLEYYESEHTDEKRLAPLVFLPVSVDRVLVEQRWSYFVKGRNEDVTINIALAELLKKMGVNLPEWEQDDQVPYPLGTYLKRVQHAIAGKRDWKVRGYVTIGLFTFSTLAMYKDLDPDRWPTQSPLEQQSVLRTLLAGAEASDVKFAEDYEVDALQGPEPLLITDADSSQHSAVVDVLRSKNSLAIQGPPGTGKSQTITNIIAAALNEGLSVLFVAEKMAALEVVKKRLDAAGLECFCFELHSSKTSKTSVAASLAQRIEYRPPRLSARLAENNAEALRKAKAELLYYVQKVNQEVGNTGRKVYDVLLGSAIRDKLRENLPPAIVEARLANPLDISPHSYRQMLDAAATLERQTQPLGIFGKIADHPWRGVMNVEITELDEGRLISVLSEWNSAIQKVTDVGDSLAQQAHIPVPQTQSALEELGQELATLKLPQVSLIVEAYRACSNVSNRNLLRYALHSFGAAVQAETVLASYTDELTRARGVGAKALDQALTALREMHIETFTVASVCKLRNEGTELVDRLATISPLQERLIQLLGLEDSSITSLRAVVAAQELLGSLPRPLWSKRSREILDEANRTTLNRAASQALELKKRRTEIESELDLRLAPSHTELRNYGLALRKSTSVGALFSRDCREAKRIFRGMSRQRSKRTRDEVADALLCCAQYLADLEGLTTDVEVKSLCGPQYQGLETPLQELLAVAEWGTSVRQRLAAFGDSGLRAREFLFAASLDELDKLQALGGQVLFGTLSVVLSELPEGSSLPWQEMVEQHRFKANRLVAVAEVFERCVFRQECNEGTLAAALDALRSAEKSISSIETTRGALSLVGGSIDNLRRNVGLLAATLEFANHVVSRALPMKLIEYLFADPAHVAEIQSWGKAILSACAELSLRRDEALGLAQIDPMLWCKVESFDQVGMPELLGRNTRALQHLTGLRDYLNFLLAEDAARDVGVGPVLSVYSDSGLDYCELGRSVEFVFYRSAAEGVLSSDPKLRRHSGASHQELRKEFRELDREYLELRRKQLAVRLQVIS